jgi:predicted metal-dependent hydrolase
MREYHIGQTVVPYEINWSPDRETIGLSLNESLELRIRAPMTATLADVESALDAKQEWLLKKLYHLNNQEGPPYDREFLSGEKLPYRGRQYRLRVVEADVPEPILSFDGQDFTLEVHRFDAPGDTVSVRRKRQAVVDWYIRQAEQEFPERCAEFESKFGLSDVSVEVQDLDRHWGEYDDVGVWLNWRLLLAPIRILDYVLVHELAHTKHNDHSDAFWNTVGSLIPDYEERRKWLRINGRMLSV